MYLIGESYKMADRNWLTLYPLNKLIRERYMIKKPYDQLMYLIQ